MASNGTLTNRQRKAIAALMSSRNVAEAAQAARVGLRTLHRWLDDPSFVAELKSAESAAIDQAVRRLADLSGLAVDSLRAVMNDTDAAHAVKIRAADIALARLMPLKELADLEARIAALESAQSSKGNGHE